MLIKRIRTPPKSTSALPAEEAANVPESNEGQVIRKCICPCGKEFSTKKGSTRKYYRTDRCQYAFKKWKKQKETQPDCYAKCSICKKWFPVWLTQSKKIPKKCNDAKCKVVQKQREDSLAYLEKMVGWPYNYIPAYSYNSALLARRTYCAHGPEGNGEQCQEYGYCLSAIARKKGKIFERFFTSKGTCYQEP